ncbi:hypothetical protein PED39_03375 [Methanomassiliicoccales archaeon LGM-RCC1]|nr:hypothetical protein PED39_03375 [Methanomassiliicoccales archaeon LGM-RCC1]
MGEMKGDSQVLCEKQSVADEAMNEAIVDYDRSIRRLEILMGIDGVILTISLQTLVTSPEGHIHSMMMVFAILMCISTGVCVIGLFKPRNANGFLNARSPNFEEISSIEELYKYEITEKTKIADSHNKLIKDVWQYTRMSMLVLSLALLILLITIIQMGTL